MRLTKCYLLVHYLCFSWTFNSLTNYGPKLEQLAIVIIERQQTHPELISSSLKSPAAIVLY